MQLFRSHNPDFKDGEQKRDFIFVNDVTNILYFFLNHRTNSGIYNVGTGEARTFLDLVKATFMAMKLPVNIGLWILQQIFVINTSTSRKLKWINCAVSVTISHLLRSKLELRNMLYPI